MSFLDDAFNTVTGFFGDQSSQYSGYGKDLNKIADEFNPMINRGNQAGEMLMPQYQNLINNPNFLQDMLSKGFTASPYQQQLIGDTTAQMNMNAANTGMIQSPAAQRALNDRISSMSGQFLNDYINRGMQSYGMGMSGLNNMQSNALQALMQRANYLTGGAGADFRGDLTRQGGINNMIGGLIGLL